MLYCKADLDQRNFNGATELIFATTFGTDNIIKMLLENGANKTIVDNYNKTVLDYAILQENESTIKLLK